MMKMLAFIGTLQRKLFHGLRKLLPSVFSVAPSPVSDGYEQHQRIEHLLMGGLGLIVFAVYSHTLCVGVYPGTSAVVTGKVLGLLPGVPVSHPVWLSVSRAVATLPFLATPYGLNLFNALVGSVAVVWLFRIVSRIAFDLIREDPVLRFVPVSDEEPEADGVLAEAAPAAASDDDAIEHVVATLGGLVSALVFAFCAPFWIASTSLHVQPLDILLLFFTADLVARYQITGKLGACVVAILLMGAGLIESPVFLVFLPVFAAVVIPSCIRYNQISESFILLMLAAGLTGAAASVALFIHVSAPEQGISAANLGPMALDYARTYRGVLIQGVPRADRLFVLIVPLLSLVMAIVGARKLTLCRDEVTRWKWRMLNAIFTAAVVAELLNLPNAVWNVARNGAQLPILPSLVVALAAGFFFVFWCQTGIVPTPSAALELDQSPLVKRVIGYGMCGLLVIVVLRAVNLNYDDGDGRKAAFADGIAQQMLAQSKPARCLVTDGTFDLNLLILSHVTGRRLTLIPAAAGNRSPSAKGRASSAAAHLVMTPPAGQLNWEPEALVERWLRNNPTGNTQVATVGMPEFWQHAGLMPQPNGLLYFGAVKTAAPDASALIAKNRASWRLIAPSLTDDPTMLPVLRRTQADVRAHVSRMANDFGICLETEGHLAEADTSYKMSLELDGKNLCAILNQYGLRLRQADAGLVGGATRQVLRLADEPRFFEEFDGTVARYGALAPQLADHLVPRIMATYPAGTPPPPNLLRLLDKWLTFSRSAFVTPAPVMNVSSDAQLVQAFQAQVEGRSDKAEKIARRIVLNRPSCMPAWSLLAEILLIRGDVGEVNDNIFPAMRALAGGVTNQFVEMTQGCLHMHAEPPRYEAARACFRRALELNPEFALANDQLLQTDVCLGNAAFIEMDALSVIQHNPSHAAANALLGSLNLVRKRFAEAEAHLGASLTCRPSSGAHSDLSELFRQQNKWADAEAHARLAIRLAPGFYQAWDTLGEVLAASGRLDQACAALRCALALRTAADEQTDISRFSLRLNQDRRTEISQLLLRVETQLAAKPVPVPELSPWGGKRTQTHARSDWTFIGRTSMPLAPAR